MKIPVLLIAGLAAGLAANAQTNPATPAPRTAAKISSTEAIRAATVPAAPVRHVRLTVLPRPDASVRHRLLDQSGKQIAVAAGDTGVIEADVHPGEPYIYVPSATGRRALAADKLEFPARYLTFDQRGQPLNEGGLFLRPMRTPLVWDSQARGYATDLIVGYDFKDGHEQPLAKPKTVTLFAQGSNARIQADTVVITRSGAPGYQRVVLTTGQLAGDTLFTARAGSVDELNASASIDREPGSLQASLPSGQIDAFGLGTGTLTITLLALDGFPLAAAAPLDIHLTSRRLRLPAMVTLATGQSTVTAEIHSLNYGDDEIRAEVGALQAAPLPVRLVFPVAAVLAAAAGGGLGGAARYLRNRHRKTSLFARRLLEGLLVGVLFVGAAWTGLVTVDIGAGILSTPFGAFVLAALSGYLGCIVLDRVTDRAFRGLKAA